MAKKWKITPFGLEVKKRLLEREWSVRDLAREIGANETYLSGLLYGKRPEYKYADAIRELLDIS